MEGEERRRPSPLKVVIFAGIFIFYLFACAVADEMLPTLSFAEKIPEEAGNASAGDLAQYLRDNEGLIDGDPEVEGFEEAEILQVLDAVSAYNEEARRTLTASYEYVHYEGMVESYDPVTGNASVTSWEERKSSDVVTGTHQELVGTERVLVEYTQEELNAMAAALHGSSFTPPPQWYDRPVYETVEDHETVETVTVHDPVTETRTETVTLSRQLAEPYGDLLGEDVYEIDWRPVLVLCYMMSRGRDDLSAGLGDRRVLPKEDVDAAINFFGYQYSFLDDAAAEGSLDGSLSRYETRNAAYRLEVTGSPEVGKVCSFDVKKVPQVAPKLMANAYLSYEYEYSQTEGEAKELTARTVSVDGNSFVSGCAELCGGEFDAELFVEFLLLLPGGEESAEHFRMLAAGYVAQEEARDADSCPAIGTLVSSKTGWEIRSADRFFAGIVAASTDGEARPSGAHVVSGVSYVPSEAALSDPSFARIWETASSCVGTKYVFGSNAGPGKSFDCSAYVSWVLRESGTLNVGRLTTTGFLGSQKGVTDAGCVTEVASPLPGDLVFFKGTIKDRDKNAVSHVAIYLGDGMIIHASGAAGCVTITALEGSDLMKNHFMLYARVRGK